MKPKVLFVRSGNRGQHPITQNQGDSLIDEGCDVYFYNVVGNGLLGYLKNLPDLRRVIRQINPDVIHAHYSLCAFLSSLCFCNRPIVVSLMGSDVLSSNKFFHLLIRFFSFFSWDLVIFKSYEMSQKLKIEKSVILPNGVNAKVFYSMNKKEARLKLNWNLESKIVLFASDPKRVEKNYPLFKESLEKVRSSGFPAEEKCLVNLTKSEMMLYFNAADVLVLTSFHEGSPNVIKEAMFCNCPFVSVDVGDVHQWISLTEGNAVVASNANELAAKIIQILQNNIEPENNLVRDLLDSQLIAQKLKNVYLDLIVDS